MRTPHTRYARTDEGKLIIDIAISKYNELYDDWDNTASYLKKDLDADLVDYLYECFDEVKKKEFQIKISVPTRNYKKQEKVKKSIKTYFEYMAEKEKTKLKNNMRMTFSYFLLGITCIVMSSILRNNTNSESLVYEVLIEGMIIIGWVTLWQVTVGILSEWNSIYKEIKIYNKIAATEVIFEKR